MNNGRRNRSLLWLAVSLSIAVALCGCFGKKKAAGPATGASAEPDKVLYDTAMTDIKKDRFDEGRLAFQTLINTYPDSEYLAKAKLAVADSYYKEGGISGLTQAVAEYQDFITFFPFLDEAAYAQMQIGMAHYKRMEKPDRDRDEALEAEGAFQTFLQKYPSNPLYKDAQQRLRDVQEVLADGDFRVAEFYYMRKADRAAVARLNQLVTRYPLYSQADRANWMLASVYERTEHADIANQYYANIVKEYPLSPLAAEAKARLVKFGTPVPQPDPDALARMQAEQQAPRPANRLITRPMGALKSGPDVRMAARSGTPTMTPEDTAPSTDTLIPGGTGNTVVGVATAGGASGGAGSNTNAAATTDVEGVAPTPAAESASSPTAEVVVTQPVAGSEGAQPVSTGGASTPATDGATAGDTTNTATTQAANTSADTPASSQSTSSSKESTNKKKKGLRKLIP